VRYDDLPLETVDGRSIHVEFVSNVYMVNQRKVIQCNIRDITIRKLTETEIIESKKLAEELYIHLNDVRENERAEISREIHDELGQVHTGIKAHLNKLRSKITDPDCTIIMEELRLLLQEATDMVHHITLNLEPDVLRDLDIGFAVAFLADKHENNAGYRISREIDDSIILDKEISLNIYRIVQESFNNIIKHAQATATDIKFMKQDNNVIIEIIDNGIGIDAEILKSRNIYGLTGIRQRVGYCDGIISIESKKNKGTKIKVIIPIEDNKQVLASQSLRSVYFITDLLFVKLFTVSAISLTR